MNDDNGDYLAPPEVRIDQCDEDQLAMAALMGCDTTKADRVFAKYYVEAGDDGARIEERPSLVTDWRGVPRLIGPNGDVSVYAPRPSSAVPPLRLVH